MSGVVGGAVGVLWQDDGEPGVSTSRAALLRLVLGVVVQETFIGAIIIGKSRELRNLTALPSWRLVALQAFSRFLWTTWIVLEYSAINRIENLNA